MVVVNVNCQYNGRFRLGSEEIEYSFKCLQASWYYPWQLALPLISNKRQVHLSCIWRSGDGGRARAQGVAPFHAFGSSDWRITRHLFVKMGVELSLSLWEIVLICGFGLGIGGVNSQRRFCRHVSMRFRPRFRDFVNSGLSVPVKVTARNNCGTFSYSLIDLPLPNGQPCILYEKYG